MLLKLYKGIGPGVVALILLTACCVWLGAFLKPSFPVSFYYDINPMPLYNLLKQIIGGNAFYGTIFIFSLLLLMMFLITNFNTTHFFINERTFLPSVIFVLLTGLFPHYQLLNPVLPASVFLMLAVRRITESYRKPGVAYNFFDASFLVGTGFLFYANIIWFGVLVFIGINIFRSASAKELIGAIIGLITPVIITVGFYYAAGMDVSSLKDIIWFNLFVESDKFSFSILIISGIILLGIIVLISILHLASHLNNKKIKSRKTFTILIWCLVISLIVYIAVPSSSVEIIWLTAIPVSYITAHYLVFSRNKILSEIIFGMLFLIIVFMQVLNLKQV